MKRVERFREMVLFIATLAAAFLMAASIHDARAGSDDGAESIMDRLAVSNDATKCVTIVAAYAQGMWFYGEGHDAVSDFPLPDGVAPGTEDASFFLGLTAAGWQTMKDHIAESHQADLDQAEGTQWEGKITFNRAQAAVIAQRVYKGLRDSCNAGGGWHVVKDLPNFDDRTMGVMRLLLGPDRGSAI